MRALIALVALMLAAVAPIHIPGAMAGSPFTGCYGEASVSGTFLATDRTANGGLGVGCDATLGAFVAGALARGDVRDAGSFEVDARLGVLINPHVLAYGLAGWRVSDLGSVGTGSAHLGAGLELFTPVDRLTMFAEFSHAVASIGTASIDDATIRGGVRYRFTGW